MIRVLVVDDSTFLRKALKRVLESDPSIRVVGEASRGDQALELVDALAPDLVTLDVEMPGLDGLSTLRALVERHPGLPVVMISALTRDGAEITLEALATGAVDFIDKTSIGVMDLDGLSSRVLEKVRIWAPGRANGRPPGQRLAVAPSAVEPVDWSRYDLVVVGASTGGPPALQAIVGRIRGDFPLPILVVQHMPPGFTGPFAARLDRIARVDVREASDREPLAPGTIRLAPAGWHLSIDDERRTRLSDEPKLAHRPSVDVLFRSAAAVTGARTVGILLTGMGDDGAAGLLALRQAGATTLAESRETCVVYGMPGSAERLGAVERLLPLPDIASLFES